MSQIAFLPTAQVALGIGALTVGAEALVRGASRLAERLGLSPLVVGLTVVAFGTSMPELAVSVGSGLIGNGGVALGNVVGSNIFNILVVLGGAAFIRPLVVNRQLVRLDVPVMIATSLLLLLLSLDGRLGSYDGALLLSLGVIYAAALVGTGRVLTENGGASVAADANGTAATARNTTPADVVRNTSAPGAYAVAASPAGGAVDLGAVPAQVAWIFVGLIFLLVGARLVVLGAAEVAHILGVSDLMVGLTVVAAGTSLPELATSFVAAFHDQRDIAVGNVVGSNVFNVLAVLGSAALVERGGIPVPEGVRTFDMLVMLGVSLACLPIFFTGWAVSRREGLLFLAYYGAYITYLILHHLHHAAEDVVGTALLFFALPLTILTLGVHVLRQVRTRPRVPADP